MTLGEKVSALRKQRGLSQEDLAAKLHITRQAISRWEQDESVPDIDNILQLSNIFGVSTDYLLKDGSFTAVMPPERHLPREEKRLVPWFGRWLAGFFLSYSGATVIYLILGFGFDLWHPGWVIFPLLALVLSAMASWRAFRDGKGDGRYNEDDEDDDD